MFELGLKCPLIEVDYLKQNVKMFYISYKSKRNPKLRVQFNRTYMTNYKSNITHIKNTDYPIYSKVENEINLITNILMALLF